MSAFRVWALMPIGNPKSIQAWDGAKYLGQLYVEIMRVLDIGDPPPFESIFRPDEEPQHP
jgi:hypothetical protein